MPPCENVYVPYYCAIFGKVQVWYRAKKKVLKVTIDESKSCGKTGIIIIIPLFCEKRK